MKRDRNGAGSSGNSRRGKSSESADPYEAIPYPTVDADKAAKQDEDQEYQDLSSTADSSLDLASEYEDEPDIDLSRQRSARVGGAIDERSLHNLIDIKSSLSTIELTLIAITVAVIVLKVAVTELANQLGSAMSGGEARRLLDVSISVGFVAIVVATLQIPRHFTDALIHSNQDAMRILQMVGATPRLIARCLAGLVLRSMLKAAWKGLVVAAILYLVISELAQWWVPVTRTYFLREVAEAVCGIAVFIVAMYILLRVKVSRFFASYTRT